MTHVVDLNASVPPAIAGDAGGVWVAGSRVLQHRDAETGAVLTAVETGVERPLGVAVRGDRVALSHASGVTIVDPVHLDRTVELATPTAPSMIGAHGDRTWLGSRGERWVMEITPAGATTTERLDAPLAGLTADDAGAWWIATGSDRLRNGARSVGIRDDVGDGVAVAACSGVVWLSTETGLVWVRSRAGEFGGVMPSPVGRVHRLGCVSGALVGGDDLDAVFVLNPASDVHARRLEVRRRGRVAAIAGSRGVAWLVGDDGVASLAAV